MTVEKLLDYGRSFYTLLGERRKSERMDFSCNVTVSCKDRYGQLITHMCACLNISDRGIGLISPEPITVGSDVYIHSETHNVKKFGRVCYSVPKGDRVFVGCSFRPAPEYWN